MKNEELTTLKFSYPEGQERTVRVYVPAHGDDETLPVIYMTDGQNLRAAARRRSLSEYSMTEVPFSAQTSLHPRRSESWLFRPRCPRKREGLWILRESRLTILW